MFHFPHSFSGLSYLTVTMEIETVLIRRSNTITFLWNHALMDTPWVLVATWAVRYHLTTFHTAIMPFATYDKPDINGCVSTKHASCGIIYVRVPRRLNVIILVAATRQQDRTLMASITTIGMDLNFSKNYNNGIIQNINIIYK